MREKMQKDIEKNLKKLGWPDVELASDAASSMPKILVCITRRLARMTDLQGDLEKILPPPPSEDAPAEQKEKYNKGIRQKMLVSAIIPNVGSYRSYKCLTMHGAASTVNMLRMLAKLQGCHAELEELSDELSELKATGLVDGFDEKFGSNKVFTRILRLHDRVSYSLDI